MPSLSEFHRPSLYKMRPCTEPCWRRSSRSPKPSEGYVERAAAFHDVHNWHPHIRYRSSFQTAHLQLRARSALQGSFFLRTRGGNQFRLVIWTWSYNLLQAPASHHENNAASCAVEYLKNIERGVPARGFLKKI